MPEDRTLIFSEKDQIFFAGLKNFLAGNSLDALSETLVSEIEKTFLKSYADPLLNNLAVLPQLKETFQINNREREAANIFFSLGELAYLAEHVDSADYNLKKRLPFQGGSRRLKQPKELGGGLRSLAQSP